MNYWAAAIPEIKYYKEGKTITFLGEADIVQDKTTLLYAGFDYDYAWGFQERKLKSFGPNGTSAATVWGYCNDLITNSTGVSHRIAGPSPPRRPGEGRCNRSSRFAAPYCSGSSH